MTEREARAALSSAGVPDPARDAHVLARAAPDARTLAGWIARRAAREPVSHILGRRAFWNHEFRVTADVLDPRPETETLVEQALAAPFARVLDLGTGSGCILLSLLAERPAATGLGTDLSEAALDVARENAAALGLADRAAFRRADWLAGVEGRFDLVVSNPPYIAEAELPALAPELGFEPALALSPGGDGLDAYRTIARDAPERLTPGGRLMVEIGPTQADAVSALFAGAGLTDIAVCRDLAGRDRVVAGGKAAT
ncbi:peptide chain release factor N(5)-glutamine methyltransferase [uncultured Jannaschia sp.]|uniref:peptide chain release factor N(5)-glutamine methyltransferase n=1 Tax=uncultured Jannaschia sp. TaxID=293347 RepID=UPI002619B11D|nr:peptide chain release factor N(5)-glutamine methyltransferase [uncultured Jannaschia sp.]